jgi:hypothetical protein
LLALNLIPLVIYASIPTRTEVGLFRDIYHHDIHELHTLGVNPYRAASTPFYFYRPEPLQVVKEKSASSFIATLAARREPLWFFDEKGTLPALLAPLCKEEFSTIPGFLRDARWLRLARTSAWTVYRCHPPTR